MASNRANAEGVYPLGTDNKGNKMVRDPQRSTYVISLLDIIFQKYIVTDKITVSEFAKMVGVTRAQIYNWKKGLNAPSDMAMQKLLVAVDNLASKG